METINEKIINRTTKDVEFTNEEWAKIKAYIEENPTHTFSTFGLDKVEVLALYMRLRLTEIINDGDFFYNECEYEYAVFQWAKALIELSKG